MRGGYAPFGGPPGSRRPAARPRVVTGGTTPTQPNPEHVYCPDCRGVPVRERVIALHGDEERAYVETWTCPTCRGTGAVSPIRAAIFRARGGPAPVQRKGYA